MLASWVKPLHELDLIGGSGRAAQIGVFLAAWRECRHRGALCEWLAAAVGSRQNGVQEKEAELWRRLELLVPLAERHVAAERRSLERVNDLIKTARALACNPKSLDAKGVAIDDAASGLAITTDRQFNAVVRRTLAGAPLLGNPVTVPVAFEDQKNGRGCICRLHLEVVAGDRSVANHPEQYIDGAFDSTDIVGPMNLAWEAALMEVFGKTEANFCGRWQLWKWSQQAVPFPDPTGGSLGAAAARGWCAALGQAARASGINVTTPLVADARVLPIAEVVGDTQRGFTLASVDSNGVFRKVCAIADLRQSADAYVPIDRVVVVGKENMIKAEEAILSANLSGLVDVKQLDAA